MCCSQFRKLRKSKVPADVVSGEGPFFIDDTFYASSYGRKAMGAEKLLRPIF
jgi:hypothetical protein